MSPEAKGWAKSINVHPVKNYLAGLALLIAFATASASGQGVTLVQPPRTKSIEFTGTQVLFILGIDAFQTEIRFTRPQKIEKATLVAGRTERGVAVEKEFPLGEMHGFPAVNQYAVGLAVRQAERQLITILDGQWTMQSLPDGFEYNYPRYSKDGIYDRGLVIFAYEPRSDGKVPASKADCLRYFGIRLYLKD